MMNNQTLLPSSFLLDHDVAKWIIGKIDKMEGRAKFCSYNALQFLRWANEIFATSHIVSSFCALNATEEAVAAFVSAAKAHGHKKYAKLINLHNHRSKALVSVYARRCSRLAKQGNLAIAVHQDLDKLAFRAPKGGEYRYGTLSLSNFRVNSNTNHEVDCHIQLGNMPSLEELEEEIIRVAESRNKLLYATDDGYQTGFIEPEACLSSETKLSLGLIWASVDMYMNSGQDRPFIEEIFEQMATLSETSGAQRREMVHDD